MNFVLTHGEWNTQAALNLEPALPHDPDFNINDLAFSVQTKESTLFHLLNRAGGQVANFVLRKDGSEMVLVAVGGFIKGSITKICEPFVMEVARLNGCTSLRCHTRKEGIGKLAERVGWKKSETIYRKEVI